MKMVIITTVLLLSLCFSQLTNAAVEFVAILPHGDWVYDPSFIGGVNGSSELHTAAIKISRQIVAYSPEIIVLISPHAVTLDEDYGIYTSARAEGFADIGLDAHNSSAPIYRIFAKTRMEPTLAQSFIKVLRASGIGASGISFFSSDEAAPLRWGEVIPLAMLSSPPAHSHDPTSPWSWKADFDPIIVLVSPPLRRLTDPAGMVPELLAVGTALRRALDGDARPSALLVSADLAHTHPNPVRAHDEFHPIQ
jgi:aromatic ring-opening dioxygenase LigB subunit